MAQFKIVYEGKGANLAGKAWRYEATGGKWEEGNAEGQSYHCRCKIAITNL